MKNINLIKKCLTVCLLLLTMAVGEVWAYTATFRCVPALTFGSNWSSGNTCKVKLKQGDDKGDATYNMSGTGLMYKSGGNLYEIYAGTATDLPYDGAKKLHFERWDGSTWKENAGDYDDWRDGSAWSGSMHYGSWGSFSYETFDISAGTTIYFDNSDLNCTNVRLYFFKSGWDQDVSDNNFTQIAGTPYWYKTYSSAWEGYAGLVFKNQGNWDKKSGNIYQDISGTSTCFTPTSGDNGASLSTTAPVGPKNVSISNTASVVRGSGTEGSPYVVAHGTSLTQSVSAATIDASTTLYYKFSAGTATSYSTSTTTNTRQESAVAGTSYTVYATVKTMKSSNSSRAFNTSTLYYTTAYTITLNRNGGTGGDGTSYAVNGKAAINPTSIPTKSGKGFDGYWTGEGGTGTQVINEKGQWNQGVAGYTDNSGNWICTSNSTLYARWLDPGYYMVGGFNSWKATSKMSGSGPYTWDTESLDPGDYTSNKTEFKIRKVVEGSGTLDTWYGGSSSGIELGKGAPSSTSISSPGNNFVLQVYYDGVYSFTWTANSKIQVAVPVIDQLRIYKDNDVSVSNYTDWDDPSAATVTATVALERGHTYQFKPVLESVYYGKGSGGSFTTLTRDARSVTVGTGSSNENNVKLSADLKGNYTFNFNTSTKVVSVTYPTRRSVTYTVSTLRSGNGTASGANGSLTAVNTDDGNVNISTLSNYVADGNHVLLTAPSAKSGYQFKGWYKGAANSSNWSTNQITTNTTCTITVNKDTTVYAVYYEPTYTVSIAVDDEYSDNGGHVEQNSSTVTSVSNVGKDSYAQITAVPANLGWRFKQWNIPSGVTIKSGYTTTTATIQINATASSKTVTAVFEPKFCLFGSKKDNSGNGGMPGWSSAADFAVTSYTSSSSMSLNCTRTLEPNTEYRFQVYDRQYTTYRSGNTNATMVANASWTLTGSNNQIYYKTAGYGDYRFEITQINGSNQPSIHIIRPTSYEIVFGTLTSFNEGESYTSAGTGGSVGVKTTENAVDYTINTGDSIRSGGTAVFTATPQDGYTFAGWYTNSTCTTPYSAGAGVSISDNVLTLSSIGANKTVYAKFTENMTTVAIYENYSGRGTLTVASAAYTWGNSIKVGVHTHKALSVTANTGYYFAGWTKTEGTDYKLGSDAASDYNEDSKTPTLKGKGTGATSGQVLTANFLPLEKVYFRNWNDEANAGAGAKLWDRVYVYFSISYEKDGSNNDCAKSNSSSAFYTEMQLEEGTSNIYWAYVPRATTRRINDCDDDIAFSNHNFGTNYKFNGYEAVMRGDYRTNLSMFVPRHASNYTRNSTKYYNGYWKHHNRDAGSFSGYSIVRYTGSGYVDPANNGEDVRSFMVKNENTIQYTLRVDNLAAGHNKFMIYSDAEIHYITYNSSPAESGYNITTSNCTNVHMSEYNSGSPRFEIVPTSEGIYTLSIDMSSDEMKLSVNYPVAVGDYRLKHTYSDGSTKTTYSDIIKSGATSTTASMYLNPSSTPTLVLEKCTAVSPLTWTVQGSNIWSTHSSKFNAGKGVYQFDIAISSGSPSTISSLTNAAIYEGNFYIKTNCAPGGWTSYKSNILEKNTINFSKSDASTFDYYMCRNASEGQNVKFVIANEYNIAITDSIKGDATFLTGGNKENVPETCNIRFSYNSVTNEAKRAYLRYSTNDDFLRIEGAASDGASHIYTTGGTRKASIKFEDKQNWRYEIVIQADVNARAKLTAAFNGQTQYFWGAAGDFSDANTVELFGGEEGKYGLTLVYDFKTNKLISAWTPIGSEIGADLTINSDVILLREHQGAPTSITFGMKDASNYASLSEVKTVYSVLRFNRWKLSNRAHPEDLNSDHCDGGAADYNEYHAELSPGDAGYLSQYERELYFISFPYDVKMSDIIHFGGYYDTWGIMYYDGKNRAKNGYWIDSPPNWKYFTPEEFATKKLNAYEGYLIGIDLEAMRYDNTSFWTNNSCEADIYFPSQTTISKITQQEVTVNIDQDGYLCTINRDYGGNDGDRRIKDSYWHCIGVPAYADLSHSITGTKPTNWSNKSLLYLYEWNTATNGHTIKAASSFDFQAMYAYLVQYAGTTLSWAAAAATGPSSIAARRMKTEELRNRQFNLQLLQDDKEADHTYIRLSDDEEVTDGFEFNHDVSKMMLDGANIYTLIGYEQAAANSLPLNTEQTTVVPVGVKIAAEGEYTFAMPEGTNGVSAVLVDQTTNTRTNLALTDYSVNLETGTYDERFSLELYPIAQTPTDIENGTNINTETNIRKVLVDGVLYIVKDGIVFDARGNRVR